METRFEESNGKLHLYFKHTSGRNFVVSEDIDNDRSAARVRLVRRMNEMNGVDDGERPGAQPTES